ncbi:MAG: DUF6969 family protein [Rhodospirillales bacterium]
MTTAQSELRAMAQAGARAAGCARVLAGARGNVVSELLRGQGEFYQWDHYPKGDVYDARTGAQYYYHAHPPGARKDICEGEHGHFHTFVRPKDETNAPTHLIAVSMDRRGAPVRLFTANRWVTGETWKNAVEAKRLLAGFRIDTPQPSRPVNEWITAMLALFKPVIEQLLDERDAAVAAWAARHPGMTAEDVFEDRRLEVTSYADISFDARVAEITAALAS